MKHIVKILSLVLVYASFTTEAYHQQSHSPKRGIASAENTAKQLSNQPNLIVIISDDQGYADIGVAGLASDVNTPSLDKLANEGVRFTQAYVTSPICSTSRLGLITGTYTQRTGGYFYGEEGAISPKLTTIAEMLKTKDYTTGYVGKYHYGHSNPEARDFPLNHGFDRFYGTAGAFGRKHYLIHDDEQNDQFIKKMKKFARKGQTLGMNSIWDNRTLVKPKGFATELYGQKAREFIKDNKDKPFYLQLAFNAVHNFTHQLPDDYLKKHQLNTVKDWDPAEEEYYAWYQKGRYPNNKQGREYFLGQLAYLDNEVGKVLATVEEQGLKDNTIVIFVSDNGGSTPIYADNTPLRGSKYVLYEGGIRVPMIVSWPGKFTANTVLENVVSTMDILPTIANITGSKPHQYVDGLDITSLLNGTDSGVHHQTLVWDTGLGTAVRHGKWKLKTASDLSNSNAEMVVEELGTFLYDLEKDPSESQDLAPLYPEVVKQLQDIYRRWDAEMRKGL
jgi:arylsulfatase A-like enzyme